MKYRRKSKTVSFYATYDGDGILHLEALQNIYPVKKGDDIRVDDWVLYERKEMGK